MVHAALLIRRKRPAFSASTALSARSLNDGTIPGLQPRLRIRLNDKIGLEPAALPQLADLTGEFMMQTIPAGSISGNFNKAVRESPGGDRRCCRRNSDIIPKYSLSRTVLIPDTTAYSLVHRLAGYRGLESPPLHKVKIYFATVTVIYLPLAIVALLGSGTPTDHLHLFHDWAASFVLLVSCPALVILMVTDDYVLAYFPEARATKRSCSDC